MPQLVDGDVEAKIRGRLRGAAVDAGIEMRSIDTEILERETIGNASQRPCGGDAAAQQAVDGRLPVEISRKLASMAAAMS